MLDKSQRRVCQSINHTIMKYMVLTLIIATAETLDLQLSVAIFVSVHILPRFWQDGGFARS